MPFNDYLSIQYVEDESIYFIVHGPVEEMRQVLLCKYDMKNRETTILDEFEGEDLYISSFAYLNDQLVYSTMKSYDERYEEYTMYVKQGEETVEVDRDHLLTSYVNSIPKLIKVGNHLYYGTVFHDLDESGNGIGGYKFVKVLDDAVEVLFSNEFKIREYVGDWETSERYRKLIFNDEWVAALTWSNTKSYVYLYNDRTSEKKIVEADGMQDYMGIMNDELFYAEVFDGMSYYQTELPYMLYDLSNDTIDEIGEDIYQYTSSLGTNALYCFDERDNYRVIYKDGTSDIKVINIDFEGIESLPLFGGTAYPLNENQFVITTVNEVWLCEVQ